MMVHTYIPIKRLITGIFIISLCLSAFVDEAYAEEKKDLNSPVVATAGVDRDTITIGDKITYTVTVQADKDIEIKFPSFADNLAGFAVKDFGSSESGIFRKRTLTQWYILDTYVTGAYTIPGAIIHYKNKKGEEKWQEAVTDEVKVTVESIMEDASAGAEIRDIKGPLTFPGSWKIFAYVGIPIIVLCAAFFLISRLNKKKPDAAAPSRPAHEAAYEALNELKRKNLLKTGDIKRFYSELSTIARRYIENRFGLRAPEMTTEEFLSSLKDRNELRSEHKTLLREFLSHCDMVKFAKYNPANKEIEASIEAAERFIDQTREDTTAEGTE